MAFAAQAQHAVSRSPGKAWRRSAHLGTLCTALMLLLACGDERPSGLDERAAWLREMFLRDNRDLLERSPELTAGKALKMAADPYAYLRGTANVYWRDALQPGGALRVETRYGVAEPVALVGDIHPENFGSFRAADGTLVFDINDFDAAMYGPFHLEVRRLALGFAVLADDHPQLDPRALASAAAAGYVVGMSRPEETPSTRFDSPSAAAAASAVIADLLRRSVRDGAAGLPLAEVLDEDESEPRLRRGDRRVSDVPGVIGDSLAPLAAEEAARLEALVESYLQREGTPLGWGVAPPGRPGERSSPPRLIDAGRRLGVGVSSYALARYDLLLRVPRPDGEQELHLLECKELVDPPVLDGITLLQPRTARTHGERVVRAAREMQQTHANDPWQGWATSGAWSLVFRSRSGYQKGVSTSRVRERAADGRFAPADVEALAFTCGAVLAQAHARRPTLGGGDARALISTTIGEASPDFVAETADAAMHALAVFRADYARFRAIVDAYGPRLGYQRVTR